LSAGIRVAILGATGAVGAELIALLEQRQFPVAELKLLASPRSAGRQMPFRGESLPVEPVSEAALADADLVLASAGSATAKTWVPKAVAAGAVVIDNSSAFRLDPQVPLVVPEVNPEAAAGHRGAIANPNCTTSLMATAVWPLHRLQPLKRLLATTYQSASGAGAQAMAELKAQARAILEGQEPPTEAFAHPLAFNVFPHESPLDASGYCQEERKLIDETRKIFNAPELPVSATCVRVPVLRAHAEALNLEFGSPLALERAREALAQAPGIEMVEDWQANHFPMPAEATGRDPVLVGRLRRDASHPNALELWLCGDQIRKGAALNAVQIAELLQRENRIHPAASAMAV
jgi:aspartate-semialdehyde dehydrogenase